MQSNLIASRPRIIDVSNLGLIKILFWQLFNQVLITYSLGPVKKITPVSAGEPARISSSQRQLQVRCGLMQPMILSCSQHALQTYVEQSN